MKTFKKMRSELKLILLFTLIFTISFSTAGFFDKLTAYAINEEINCDSGCLENNICYGLGSIKNSKYCDIKTNSFIYMKSSNEKCNNNFECLSERCVDSKCISESVFEKFINWLKNLFDVEGGEDKIDPNSRHEEKKIDSCADYPGNICESFEVCDGRVLEVTDSNRCCTGVCKLPSSFDWRNRHGVNWNSPVKNQGSRGSCHTFAPLATFEAAINLYYNQKLDIDLAEMATVSCSTELYEITIDGAAKGCNALYNSPICLAKTVGFPEESCLPYDGSSDSYIPACSLCENYEEKVWKVSDFGQLKTTFQMQFYDPETAEESNTELFSENKLKEYLITYGPTRISLWSIPHAVAVVGWEGEKENLTLIFKNSWGENWYEKGYGKTEAKSCINRNGEEDCSNEIDMIYIKTPIIPPSGTDYEIVCEDKDNDNFCNWGISEIMPDTCPEYCKDEKDWDDSDPTIGALGIYETFYPIEKNKKD